MAARKYPDTRVFEAARLREVGVAVPEIVRRPGLPRSAVHYHCLKRGADGPPAAHRSEQVRTVMAYNRAGIVVRRFSAAEDALLLRLVAEGPGFGTIARRPGRKPHSVTQRLTALARQLRGAREGCR